MAATVLASPFAALAQPADGFYIGGGVGANYMQHENFQIGSAGGGSGSTDLKSRIGPAFSLSAGYGLGNGLRVELEGTYKENGFYRGDNSVTNAGGQEQKFGPMVNVLYDFNGLGPIVPYIGAGAGFQWAKESNLHASGPGFVTSAANNTEGSFAYQGILGVAYPISSAPGLAVTADYRFMGLTSNRSYGGSLTSGGTTFPANWRSTNNYNHSLLIGLRYAFGAPATMAPMTSAPPAAVAPAPVSRSYIVFFDWDRADLSDRARLIVADAAANAGKVQYTQLEVNGYTDSSGTPKYNQGLSIRRAQVVASELVKDGVPKSAIVIQGFGETHQLVPTADGVREPQNRRVEIIIK
jgi:outer membrane protein OmpA-like peptidoglycan-associated protein